MIKPCRPTLWLAILLAAGIMLVPHRGAAMMGPHRWYDPPQMGEPDDPPRALRVPVTVLPAYWLVNTVVKRVIDPLGRTTTDAAKNDLRSRSR